PFSANELASYVDHRTTGLADLSQDWINRSAGILWDTTAGNISKSTMEKLRQRTLNTYKSSWSHGKILSFAKAFLRYLTTTRLDTRYLAFALFLEMPKAVKVRKAVTSRIITLADIENVLAYIRRAAQTGAISEQRMLQYSAFVIFGAYTGQRSNATIRKLTVGQFREALQQEKPCIRIEASQDKIRFEHFVPLHDRVIDAVHPLLDGRDDDECMFEYASFLPWIKRQKIQMSRFRGHFVLGDLRKFAEQCGDLIGWDQSNRAYIMTHGVSGIDWKHYKHPPPEHVYNVSMKLKADLKGRTTPIKVHLCQVIQKSRWQ
ncbi:MAG: hypothetical protein ACXV5H_07145, partial [Halobacteriota archaeon]